MNIFDVGEWGIAWAFFTNLTGVFFLIGSIFFVFRAIVNGFNWQQLFPKK